MNSYRKIKRHYKRLQNHPLTQENLYLGLLRYLHFNIRSKITKEQTVHWIGNLKLYIRNGDAGLVGNIYYGLYEFEESIFLLHFLREEDIFLDIGANLGHYSLLVSGIRKCKSITVEPVPATYNQLIRNIKLNNLENRIETLQIGVADKEGVFYFSTDRNTMDRIVSSNYNNSVEVPVKTIDDIIKNEIPIALKMDVEGYEIFALKGGKRILNSPALKVLILELNKSGEKYGIDDQSIYELLLGYGFQPFDYDFMSRKLIPLETYNTHKFNTIFIRDDNFVQNRLSESEKIQIRNMIF